MFMERNCRKVIEGSGLTARVVLKNSIDAGNFSITSAFDNLYMGNAASKIEGSLSRPRFFCCWSIFFGFSILPCLGMVTARTLGGQLIIRENIQWMLSFTIETGFASESQSCQPIHYSIEYSTDFPTRSAMVDQGRVATTIPVRIVDWWHRP